MSRTPALVTSSRRDKIDFSGAWRWNISLAKQMENVSILHLQNAAICYFSVDLCQNSEVGILKKSLFRLKYPALGRGKERLHWITNIQLGMVLSHVKLEQHSCFHWLHILREYEFMLIPCDVVYSHRYYDYYNSSERRRKGRQSSTQVMNSWWTRRQLLVSWCLINPLKLHNKLITNSLRPQILLQTHRGAECNTPRFEEYELDHNIILYKEITPNMSCFHCQ